jgi:hypothetical protein
MPHSQLVNELVEATDKASCPVWAAATAVSACSSSTNRANVQIEPRGAELQFQIFTEHEGRSSITISTILPS